MNQNNIENTDLIKKTEWVTPAIEKLSIKSTLGSSPGIPENASSTGSGV